VRTQKDRVTYSQRSEMKTKKNYTKDKQMGERKRNKNEQNRKLRKQATKMNKSLARKRNKIDGRKKGGKERWNDTK
jgi:hypothetical protein